MSDRAQLRGDENGAAEGRRLDETLQRVAKNRWHTCAPSPQLAQIRFGNAFLAPSCRPRPQYQRSHNTPHLLQWILDALPSSPILLRLSLSLEDPIHLEAFLKILNIRPYRFLQ